MTPRPKLLRGAPVLLLEGGPVNICTDCVLAGVDAAPCRHAKAGDDSARLRGARRAGPKRRAPVPIKAERMYPPILDPDESVVWPGTAEVIATVGRALVTMSEGPVHISDGRLAADLLEKLVSEIRRAVGLAEFAHSARCKRQGERR